MVYTWDRPDDRGHTGAPETFLLPQLGFTVMLPARHEEEVIQETIERVVCTNYPQHLVEAMEYFFWFKSRLHYQARLGMIPLGGNTVFFRWKQARVRRDTARRPPAC